jgi:hypothetical protein
MDRFDKDFIFRVQPEKYCPYGDKDQAAARVKIFNEALRP